MLSAGHVYSEYATNFLQDADSKSNTHHVVDFDRNTIRFRVEEMVNQESVPIVELKDTQEIIVLITLHYHNLHQTT